MGDFLEKSIYCIALFLGFIVAIPITIWWRSKFIYITNDRFGSWLQSFLWPCVLSMSFFLLLAAPLIWLIHFIFAHIALIFSIIFVILLVLFMRCSTVSSSNEGEPDNEETTYNIAGKEMNKKQIVIALLMLVSLAIVGMDLLSDEDKPVSHSSQTVQQTTSNKIERQQTKNDVNELVNKAVGDEQNLKKAQEEATRYNIEGTVVATSYGHNSDGFLLISKKQPSDTTKRITIIDRKNNRIAYVDRFESQEQNGSNINAIKLLVSIPHDIEDQDRNAGTWSGDRHDIPIWVEYEFDLNHNVIPGKIKTINKNTSLSENGNFTEWLYEQKNVDMINLFLTELEPLVNNAREHNVT